MSTSESQIYHGKVKECNVNGPWGQITLENGALVWFNENSPVEECERLRQGDSVQFRLYYHQQQQTWEAIDLRRLHELRADQDVRDTPVHPAESSDDDSRGESEPNPQEHPAESSDYDDSRGEPEPNPQEHPAESSDYDDSRGEPEPNLQEHDARIASEVSELPRHTGVVRFFDQKKGYGFIARDDGAEFFVHRKNIAGDGFRYLVKEEPVEFSIQPSEKEGKNEAVAVHSPAYRQQGAVKSWNNSKGFGWIQPANGGSKVFLHHSKILGRTGSGRTTTEEGELVEFEIEQSDRSPAAVRVKRLDSRLPLFKFANMGPDERWLGSLAEKAEKETWEYQHAKNQSSYPVLRSYLAYTFARLKEESEVAEERDRKIRFGADGSTRFACFNTGLVTPNQEPIYALFIKQDSARDGCDWRLEGFHARSDRPMLGKFDQLPEMANYFDDPKELIYDRKCELVLDVDHIVDDRIDRFPRVVQEADDPKAMARNLLHSAQERAVQRVNRNYKTAIPHYYQSRIQLLLPLCLLSASKADLALTVTRHGDQYRGGTVLTLDMAYNLARLLTKPDTEWLQP